MNLVLPFLVHVETTKMMSQVIPCLRLSCILLSWMLWRGSAFTGRARKSMVRDITVSGKGLNSMPSLVVFDLDNTLWTPELYQLRTIDRNNWYPVAHKDVKLFPAAWEVIQEIKNDPKKRFVNTKFAVASRTKSVDWAHNLLEQFELKELFHYIEIFPGDKKQHFSKLKDASGIDYKDMLFFDDSRDGRFGNCKPVSSLGVLSVHCPNGICKESIWTNALEHYKVWSMHKTPGTIIEWDNTITLGKVFDKNQRLKGTVKYVNREKRYGFIQHGDRDTSDMFFHFNALPCGEEVKEGNVLTFDVSTNSKNGKETATNIAILKDDIHESNTVSMNVFSMNLPFAALLSNGYKKLETRNGTMFLPYPEGTKMVC